MLAGGEALATVTMELGAAFGVSYWATAAGLLLLFSKVGAVRNFIGPSFADLIAAGTVAQTLELSLDLRSRVRSGVNTVAGWLGKEAPLAGYELGGAATARQLGAGRQLGATAEAGLSEIQTKILTTSVPGFQARTGLAAE